MHKMLSTTSLSQWSIKIPRMGLKGRNAMGTTMPRHRTISINCGSTSIYSSLHDKFAKAKKFINATLQNIYKRVQYLSPLLRLEYGMQGYLRVEEKDASGRDFC